jgi:hypothetical protein
MFTLTAGRVMEPKQYINVLDVVLNILQQSSLQDSLKFYDLNRDFTRWLILSDYTKRIGERTHETYCFSIVPVFFEFQKLKAAIEYLQPTDLKNTRQISNDFLRILTSDKFIHFVFSFGSTQQNPFVRSSIQNTRDTIGELRNHMEQAEEFNRDNQDFQSMRRRLHFAEQESKRDGFNYLLFDRIVLISGIVAALACIITKSTNAQAINWMSDRDNVTTYCNGIIYDFFSISYMGGNYRLNINKRCQLWTSHDEGNSKMWFDELIRIPDFIAGAFSRISLKTGSIDLSKQSYVVQKTMKSVHFFTVKRENDGLVIKRERLKA